MAVNLINYCRHKRHLKKASQSNNLGSESQKLIRLRVRKCGSEPRKCWSNKSINLE